MKGSFLAFSSSRVLKIYVQKIRRKKNSPIYRKSAVFHGIDTSMEENAKYHDVMLEFCEK